MPPSAWQPAYEQSYVASPHDLHRGQSKAPNPTALLSWQTRHDAVRKPTTASDENRAWGAAQRDASAESPSYDVDRKPEVGLRGYVALCCAQATISREPSTTVPSSSTSVGTMRLP